VSTPVDLRESIHLLCQNPLSLKYLGRNYNVVPVPVEVFDSPAHDLLRFALGVSFSAIEKVDAAEEKIGSQCVSHMHILHANLPSIKCSLETGECVVIADMSSIRKPTTKGNGRDL
jgi:hypothetical protein